MRDYQKHPTTLVAAVALAGVLAGSPALRAQEVGSTPGALAVPKLSLDPAQAPKGDLTGLSLEELMDISITTLSRVHERIDEAPGSVYKYDRDTLSIRGYHTLADLLQTVPGFTIFHKDLGFVAGVRGLNANDNEKISLLINGQNVNGMNEPDFLNGPINLNAAERVEVVVGPSSLFQQANTLAATVNVITRDVDGVTLVTSAGNDLHYSTTVMAGRKVSAEQKFTLSVTTEDRRGFDAFDSSFRRNLAGRHQAGALDQPNYFAIAKGQYGELFGQVIAYRTTLPELSINNGSLSNKGTLTDEFYTGYLRWEHAVTPTLMAVISGDLNYKRQSRENEGGLPENALQQYLSQVAYNTDWSLQWVGIQNNLLQGGIQGSYEHNLDNWYTLNSAELTVPRTELIDKSTYAVGLYLDDEYRISEQWKVIAGARIDRNTRLESNHWYPGARAGVVYDPVSWWTSKVTYNRAVRMPSAVAALNAAWGRDKPTAPEWARLAPNATEPEILSTVEWQNIWRINKARVSLTLYHQDLKNFISWFGPHTNVGDFKGDGVEFSLDLPLADSLSLWTNASYNCSTLTPFEQYQEPTGSLEQHHILTDPSGHIIGAPMVTANLGLEYKIMKDLVLAPQIRYISEQSGFDAQTDDFVTIRNRFYVDTTLTWKNLLDGKMDLTFSVQNLLNNRAPVAGQWVRDTYTPRGMTFFCGMEMRF